MAAFGPMADGLSLRTWEAEVLAEALLRVADERPELFFLDANDLDANPLCLSKQAGDGQLRRYEEGLGPAFFVRFPLAQ